MKNPQTSNIVPLDQAGDYEIAEGEPDVRGWEVTSTDGEKLGEVRNLLVDTDAMKVRYLDVETSGTGRTGSTHVLLPIGYATLRRAEKDVMVERLNRSTIDTLPAWDGGPVTREYESRIREATDPDFQPDDASMYGEEREETGYYDHPHYQDEAFRGVLSEEELAVSRRQRTGEVDVRKRVEHEHVRESVPVTREEVTVERRPLREGEADAEDIGEDEVRIPVMEEEVVAEKRTVPKEEVVVRKRQVQEEETIEADLMKERAEVERSDETGRRGRDDELLEEDRGRGGRRGPTDPDKRG